MTWSVWPATARVLASSAFLLAASPALAADGTAEPEVAFDALPPTAVVRPTNQNGQPHQAIARLIADRTALVPGETVRVGVHLTPDDGWHSYWKAPGDVGEPLRITWDLPPGATASDPVFPVPERFDDQGIVSYGYAGPTLLYSEVTVPEGLSGTVTLRARATWLVCEDSCIQGEADLALPLPVAPSAEPSPFAPLFDHHTARHPVPPLEVTGVAVESALSTSAVRPGDTFQVVFRIVPTGDAPLSLATEEGQGSWPAFTPIFDPLTTWVNGVEISEGDDGSALVVVSGEVYEVDDLPRDATIGGLLQFRLGEALIRTEVERPLPWVAAGTPVDPTSSPLFQMAGAAVPTTEDDDAGAPPVPPSSTGSTAAGSPTGPGLMRLLGFAFLGGLLLNVMPCVLPVITLKLFGLVSHAKGRAAEQRLAGLAYTAGVLVSFGLLAAAVVALKVTVGQVGWGFQFQSPLYVATLATVVFVFGLSLFGVFEIPAFGATQAANAAEGGGIRGDFLTGVFATLLATPCSAPFLGTAIGFAFAQPAPVIVAFMLVIGLGLAAPFLLVAFVPALFRFLPRPGAWMEVFKQLMGFTLVGTTIWLVDVLAAQIGTDRVIGFLAFLGFAAAGCWVFGRWGGVERARRDQALALLAAAAIATVGGFAFLDLDLAEASEDCDDGTLATDMDFDEEIPWQRFSEERLAAAAGTPVFIDFTADWCLTCKVNERTVIETEPVRAAMADCGMVPLKADWTRRDDVITEWLLRYDKAGVPFYLLVPPSGPEHAVAMPEVLTQSSLISAIEEVCG